jgi:hypothetical protein
MADTKSYKAHQRRQVIDIVGDVVTDVSSFFERPL